MKRVVVWLDGLGWTAVGCRFVGGEWVETKTVRGTGGKPAEALAALEAAFPKWVGAEVVVKRV